MTSTTFRRSARAAIWHLPIASVLASALAAVLSSALLPLAAHAAVSAEEAARLKTTLTPFGAERAASKDGRIPEWTGAYATPMAGWAPGQRRGDPFAADKPLYSVTAKNAAEYDANLTDGIKAMLKKYPDTFRLDVYPTRRTAGAPQWVYDATFVNATKATMTTKASGAVVNNAFGGIPYPIPKSGAEAILNTQLTWRGETKQSDLASYLITPEGKPVLAAANTSVQQLPYYDRNLGAEKMGPYFLYVRLNTTGPAIRAGEAILARNGLDTDDNKIWTYLPGQRRVKMLPNGCCDTPSPAAAGLATNDEIGVFSGRIDLFDWKIVGKRDVLIPYNSNRLLVPTKATDVLGAKHLKPEFVRWELHRVWVVEANLAEGKRHVAPKGRYYVDEDTWITVLGERYDARGELWKVLYQIPYVLPDMPGVASNTFGFNDLLADRWYISGLMNETTRQMMDIPPKPDAFFNPNAMAGEEAR